MLGCYVMFILVAIATGDCPKDCMCPNPEQVTCVGSGLSTLPSGFNSMEITTLDMSENDLTLITIESLTPVREVVNLKFKLNDIGTIEDGSFHVTPNLQVSYLNFSFSSCGI